MGDNPLSLKENVAPRSADVSKLQRILVINGLNIGQDFRKLPAPGKLGAAVYSGFNEKLINGNGWFYKARVKAFRASRKALTSFFVCDILRKKNGCSGTGDKGE